MRRLRVLPAVALATLILGLIGPASASAQTTTCGKRYVAGGDDIPAGNTISSTQTYPAHLIADHMAKYGWCNYDIAQNSTTSSSYNSGGQLATTWQRQPDFITLSVGEQNSTIVNLVTQCFNNVKSHDFASATSCASSISGNSQLFSSLTNDLNFTLQQYRMIMASRPWLVVAVVGYPNMYPQSGAVTSDIQSLCTGTTDTIMSCETRWNQLPAALSALDQVVQKLNTTIQNAVQPFNTGTQGRFMFVNPYSKFVGSSTTSHGHEMKMDVTLRLDQVCHLCGTQYQYFDNHKSEQNVGSGSAWFQAGSDGTDMPTYLQPADQIIDPPVVLQQESQTTSGMGVYPNDSGNKCISDLIWEAVKWKLNVGEPANTNICQ